MSGDSWKAFEGNSVTHSVAHHLMAIAELRAERGYARVTDVARLLGLTRGSVSLTLKALKQKGWVEQDENRFLLLGDHGRALVESIRAKHAILARFFSEVLELPAELAAADACKIEHLVSHDAAVRMLYFMREFNAPVAPGAPFRRSWRRSQRNCGGNTAACTVCDDVCLAKLLAVDPHKDLPPAGSRRGGKSGAKSKAKTKHSAVPPKRGGR